MDAIDRAIEFAKKFKKQNPLLEDQVADYLDLMLENIEEGESPQNELNLFIGACEDLLKD
jgi:hypothetical protein